MNFQKGVIDRAGQFQERKSGRIKIKSKENTSFNKNFFPDMVCRKILINMIKVFLLALA
jgi:hypothetical protein